LFHIRKSDIRAPRLTRHKPEEHSGRGNHSCKSGGDPASGNRAAGRGDRQQRGGDAALQARWGGHVAPGTDVIV